MSMWLSRRRGVVVLWLLGACVNALISTTTAIVTSCSFWVYNYPFLGLAAGAILLRLPIDSSDVLSKGIIAIMRMIIIHHPFVVVVGGLLLMLMFVEGTMSSIQPINSDGLVIVVVGSYQVLLLPLTPSVEVVVY